MASIEFLKERISKAEDKIAKKQGTIAKKQGWIEKRKANFANLTTENERYWATCEINNLEDDIIRLEKEIKEAQTALDGYKAQLATEAEKANSRNVPAIIEFLEAWKERATEFYRKGLTEYFETRKTLREMYAKVNAAWYGTPEYKEANAAYETANEAFRRKLYGHYHDEEYEWGGRKHHKEVKDYDGELEYIHPYDNERTLEAAMEKVAKDLKREAERKYDDIIERTNSVVGEIKDASGLRFGSTRGELNGFIIGERGKAEVETITAGGWNIQCLHLRTLIKKVKG